MRIPRRVFQMLLDQSATPERCLEAYHLQRTRLELIAERKVRRRQLTDDANIEITGRDLRERDLRPVPRIDYFHRDRMPVILRKPHGRSGKRTRPQSATQSP